MRSKRRFVRYSWVAAAVVFSAGLFCAPTALAASYSETGHIVAMSVVDGNGGPPNGVVISLDSGLPDNCSGTPFGWMWVPAGSSVIAAYVLGLWLSGNAPSVSVTVYTSGLSSNGFCQVTQVQPSS
jgi:hypothetical protein